jgi:archaemetzincin
MEFEYDKVIAVLNVDIFMPIFTHVFGEAKQGGKCGLVSVFRLKMEQDCIYPAPSLVYERAAKVALHELGHLFNLLHCEDHRCLMHFSGDLCQLDKTPFYFCRYCTAFLQGFYHFKS